MGSLVACSYIVFVPYQGTSMVGYYLHRDKNIMMNDKIKALALEAGFVFWGDEAWSPEDSISGIDWSCDYDKEFILFCELLVNKTIENPTWLD